MDRRINAVLVVQRNADELEAHGFQEPHDLSLYPVLGRDRATRVKS